MLHLGLVLILIWVSGAGAAPSDCEKALREVHIELARKNIKDRESGRPLARLSRTGPVEAHHLHADTPTRGHVVSLGSGPDVFRLIQDFPLVPNFHLVDMLFGQSEPAKVIREIQFRLRAIGEVELVNEGFVAEYGWALLEDHAAAYEAVSVRFPHLPISPRVWRLRWHVNGFGVRESLVHLHMLDFDLPAHMRILMHEYSTHGGLVGALMTGVGFQHQEAAQELLDTLEPGGVFAYEVFYGLDGALQEIGENDRSYADFLDRATVRRDLTMRVLLPKPNEQGAYGNFSRIHLIRKTDF